MKIPLPNIKYTLVNIFLFIIMFIFIIVFSSKSFLVFIGLSWALLLDLVSRYFGYGGYVAYFDKWFAINFFGTMLLGILLSKLEFLGPISDNAFKINFALFLTIENILNQVGCPPEEENKKTS